MNLEQDSLNEDIAFTQIVHEEYWKKCFFFLRTSRISGMSSFVTFEFESNISYINILCWDLIFPQFFLTLWIFMTNFEISIFHKMPAAAVLRLLRLRPQLRLRLRLRLRSKILAATRGTVKTLTSKFSNLKIGEKKLRKLKV